MSGMKSLLALLLLAAPLGADEVVLRNGSVFSGIVREEGDRITIRMDYGTMSFRKIDVRDVRKTDDPLKELEAKTQAASTAKEYFELALWARDRGLQGRSEDLLNKVIFLEPDHEGARKALGYDRHEGQWLKGDDMMVARGFVKHHGKWLKRETVEQLLAQENAEAVEYDRQKTIRLAAEMDREIQLQKIDVERERIEAERERDRRGAWWRTGYWQPGPSVIVLPSTCGPSAHPGYGPGRTLPPVPDRLFPGGTPSVTPPPTTFIQGGGGPGITTSK
jgi:hypothetical protein